MNANPEAVPTFSEQVIDFHLAVPWPDFDEIVRALFLNDPSKVIENLHRYLTPRRKKLRDTFEDLHGWGDLNEIRGAVIGVRDHFSRSSSGRPASKDVALRISLSEEERSGLKLEPVLNWTAEDTDPTDQIKSLVYAAQIN